jgi:hypothetical protein
MPAIESPSAFKDAAARPAGAAPRRIRDRRSGWPIFGALAALILVSPTVHADTLFDNLRGSWGGSGTIRYADGKSEDIRCTAYYTGGGDKLRLAIRCRGDKAEVEIRGELTAQGEKLAGTWEERTFNAAGEASGRFAADKMTLSVTGGGFSGAMTVMTAGARQVVTISTEGIKMRSVNVTLAKS